jgi:hypothetical protein
MNPDTDKTCHVCHITYEGDECPSCNPKHTYYVEVGVPDGMSGDSFEFVPCQCNDCPNNGYWNEKEAISHAKSLVKFEDSLVRVVEESGVEKWSNR